ncbi:MAG TPA: protein phosphatase 2C domain-containing protein, partial [Thermodesulfovibrionales bacterium]|nr:protein phosphatase 2C domain-containing protein [Thermodesulfovibrionales bacterium]
MEGVSVFGAGASDAGLRRAQNEDAFVVKNDLGFFVVADGMGGAAAGEVASRIFVETATGVLSGERASEEETVALVQKAFSTANESILDQARENPRYRGMGCTAEVAVFFQRSFVIGHVGDSRTYLFRQGHLEQITKDHSLVQEQVDRGLITAAEARHHPHRHVIARAVGVDGKLEIDLVK